MHMKKFREFNELKKTALMAIAFSLGDAQLQTLRAMFQDLDKEKTGVLSLKEFKDAMNAHSDIPDDEVVKIFDSLDQVSLSEVFFGSLVQPLPCSKYFGLCTVLNFLSNSLLSLFFLPGVYMYFYCLFLFSSGSYRLCEIYRVFGSGDARTIVFSRR